MKLSLDWLSDFVQFTEKSPWKIADSLSVQVAEIDKVELQGVLLEHCCIGKVLSVKKHPNADKLSLCDVQTNNGKRRVVCGGTNLREGMNVAFAHVGAQVQWHGKETMFLKKTSIRGEESEGMICAAEELGLESLFPECTGHNIIDLKSYNLAIGTPLRETFDLTDTILHVDNHAITHRPDLFSHIGFARECVAIGLAKWKKEPVYQLPKFPKNTLPFNIHVEDTTIVPRYLGCTVHLDDLPKSPLWMKKRLEATGWRSINLPIDITNYVMMEIGMPLHSFDIADLHGNVQIRRAKKGEKIRTLDDIERTLSEGAIVISDDKGIFDLLGIMGGLRSSTKDTTKNIFLHAAIVDHKIIRKTILETGHRTDAATVYEKGIPHIIAEHGFARALELFQTLIPGCAVTSKLESSGENGTPPTIHLSLQKIHSLLGINIPEKRVTGILTTLGCSLRPTLSHKEPVCEGQAYEPPLWRSDLTIEPDLIEEIGRIVGYNEIPPTLPSAPCLLPKRDLRVRFIRHALKEQNYVEILPLSIIGPELLIASNMDPHDAPVIENAFGKHESLLQPSTLPQLFVHARKNLRLAGNTLSLFTIGHIFTSTQEEHTKLGLLFLQKQNKADLKNNPALLLKKHLFTAIGSRILKVKNTKKGPHASHSGQCVDLLLGKTVIGNLFTLHLDVCAHFGLPENSAAAELDLDRLLQEMPQKNTYAPLSIYPAITYDETVARSHTDSVQDMLEKFHKQSALLENVSVADIYEGPHLKNRQYHLTLRFIYRAKDRTLKEEEAKKEHEKLMKLLHTS